MNDLFLKGVKVIRPDSEFHLKKINLLVKNGIIDYIGPEQADVADVPVLEGEDLVLTPGWVDLRANFCDPGKEQKEDIFTGLKTAVAGGFTDVAVLPDTISPIHAKNGVEYLKSRAAGHVTNLHPLAAVTLGLKGEELTEMIDLHHAGAVAFTDGHEPVWNTDILLKTLQYLQPLDGLLINRPEDKWLAKYGVMHEGLESTRLGLRGIPAAAETIMIERDLRLLAFGGGRLHFALVSSAESVALIREAKSRGLKVSCDVSAHHLIFNDSFLSGFDTSFKVSPPFRAEEDRLALIEGVKDGTIDAIVSAHEPHDEEAKKLEFDLADFGATGLQTLFPVLNELNRRGELSLTDSLPAVFKKPRLLLKLGEPGWLKGEPASFTLADTAAEWQLDKETNVSKSQNSPLFGEKLTGRVVAVANNGKIHLN